MDSSDDDTFNRTLMESSIDPFRRTQIKSSVQKSFQESPKVPLLHISAYTTEARASLDRQLSYRVQPSRYSGDSLSEKISKPSGPISIISPSLSSMSNEQEIGLPKLRRRKKKSVTFDPMEHIKIIPSLREEKEDLINWTPEGTHRKKTKILIQNFAAQNDDGGFGSIRGGSGAQNNDGGFGSIRDGFGAQNNDNCFGSIRDGFGAQNNDRVFGSIRDGFGAQNNDGGFGSIRGGFGAQNNDDCFGSTRDGFGAQNNDDCFGSTRGGFGAQNNDNNCTSLPPRPKIRKHYLDYESRFPPIRRFDFDVYESHESQTFTSFHVYCLISFFVSIFMYNLFL
uniref:Uncharacterized protein n=1 Tax=Panagrolaimus davidi TaxID=227884 RepID=A0A914R4D1_9BILA